MISKHRLGLLIFFFSAGAGLQAYELDNAPLTLDQCIHLTLERNPLALSAVHRYESALARIRQAGALNQPALDFDSDLQARPLDFKGSKESYFGISQLIEFPGRRALRKGIAATEADEISADIELLKLDLVFQVKQAFYGLLLAGEKIQYAKQNLEMAQDFQSKTEVKFKAGDAAEVEVLRARVEAAKAANSVKVAENDKRLAAAGLGFLLAREGRDPPEIQGNLRRAPVAIDAERLMAVALVNRPEMGRMRSSREGQALKLKQARLSYWPDFDAGLSRHRIDGEAKTWDFSLSVSVPLFFWQPKKGAIAEAEAAVQALRRENDHLRNTIRREVEEATLSALSARDQIELFEGEILKPAEAVYNAFLYRFEKGEISGIDLIEARRSLMEARRSYADALLNYHVTLASLERSIGRPLEGVIDEK